MRHHATLVLATLALLLAASPSACRDSPATDGADAKDASTDLALDERAPVRLGEVTFKRTSTGPPGLEVATVDKRARDALLGQPEFVPQERGQGAGPFEGSGSYRAGITDPRDGSGQLVGTVYVKLTLRQPRAQGRLEASYTTEAFVGQALTGAKERDAELGDLLLSVVEECAINLAKQLRVARASDDDLLALLDQRSDAELLGFAIPAARERKLGRAAPTLIALLEHDDREIVNLAAAALGDLGDQSAVNPLIDAGSRVQPLDRLPVLYALGELGGPEAKLYLQTLANSDEDLQVRAAAQQAFERASRKTP